MSDVKEVQIDGDGIEWDGLFGQVSLKSLSGNEAAKDLHDCFKEKAGSKEKVKFSLIFPENGLEQETREATGTVASYRDNGHEVIVLMQLESSVTIHKRKKALRQFPFHGQIKCTTPISQIH